jgi:hypothetical protein
MSYLEVKTWDEMKNHLQKEFCEINVWKKIYFVIDIDFTTLTYSKRGTDIDMMFEVYNDNMCYHGWGESATIDLKNDEARTVCFMDKTIKKSYDFFKNTEANIIFVTARHESFRKRTMDELEALEIEQPNILCVGSASKADAFMKIYCQEQESIDDNIIVVLDDEERHLTEFTKYNKTKNIRLYKYNVLQNNQNSF